MGHHQGKEIPFWNMHIPEEEWTEECPEYLKEVDEYDRAHLAIKDSDYKLMTWEDVSTIVRENRLEDFKRIPSELRRYRKYMGRIKQEYGSVMNFILKERVQWDDLNPKGQPFQDSSDIKILYNDWPYGMDPNIVHLVVWTKFPFEEQPENGDLTENSRDEIDQYVARTFHRTEHPDSVIWFKNWAALKSIHAVEHFHVMLFNPDPTLLKHLTGDDVPLSNKVDM